MPSFVETYIQGIPTPNPSTNPTTMDLPNVSCNTCRSNCPASIAPNKMKAIIVDKISVKADSKLSMFFVSSEILIFLTSPNTITELLPPTIEPSRMLSNHNQSKI